MGLRVPFIVNLGHPLPFLIQVGVEAFMRSLVVQPSNSRIFAVHAFGMVYQGCSY